MATKEKNKTMINDIIDAGSEMMDQMVETSKKLTKNIPIVNETIDKGHSVLKSNLKKQKEIADEINDKIHQSEEQFKMNKETTQNFFNKWFENQMNWSKSMMNNNPMSSFNMNGNSDWMNQWSNWMNQMNTSLSGAMNSNPWASAFNNPMNGFNMMMNQSAVQQKMNDGFNQWSSQVKQYSEMMSKTYEDWQKQIHNLTSMDAFKGMSDMHSHLNKFFEIWSPMFKSMSDKTFNNSTFAEMLNVNKYKEFMDSFFKFMPDDSQKMMNQMNSQFIEMMKNMSENPMMKMNGNMFNPMMNNNPYSNVWDMYSNWKTTMNDAVSPLTKLMNGNQMVKDAESWSELSDMMMKFQIKNSELQYMIYQNGMKVMNTLSERITNKIQSGENIDSVVNLYKEWLMIGDEIFTELFNSDAYSKLMTEVSSLQMKIKAMVDQKMEKMYFVNMPVATRTELDEVYKNIYDLKKMYRQMEKYIDMNGFNGSNQKDQKDQKKSSK
ncbi:MAG: hypothetical protein HOP11_06200 [Saprospiraceae bacterium]|nr:hypothetical protein [Saprospiraceae bacterium]